MHLEPPGKKNEAIGRSVGGLTTKIHCLAESHGNPKSLLLTGGNIHDIVVAKEILGKEISNAVMGDKGYDSDSFRADIESKGAIAVIPYKRNRKRRKSIDMILYGARHCIENLFSKIKHFRSVATRYEKTAINFLSVVCLACCVIWARL